MIVAQPSVTKVTTPPAVTVATRLLFDDHTACVVTSRVVPSDRLTVAVNCTGRPTAGVWPLGTLMASDEGVGVLRVGPVGPEHPHNDNVTTMANANFTAAPL